MNGQQETHVLAAHGIEMQFGGVHALKDVDITFSVGQWTGLIGPNGSGKTTLLNVMSGVYRPTTGSVRISDKDVTGLGPRQVSRHGLVRTFQHPQLAETLTIRENVELGADLASRRGIKIEARVAIAEVLDEFNCGDFADELPASVPYGIRKMAEIARAVLAKPQALLLDEPAAGLSREERAELVAALKSLRARRPELAVCLVEHDVRLVAAVCERILVLNLGMVLATGTAEEVLRDERVREAYLGRSTGDTAPFEMEVGQ